MSMGAGHYYCADLMGTKVPKLLCTVILGFEFSNLCVALPKGAQAIRQALIKLEQQCNRNQQESFDSLLSGRRPGLGGTASTVSLKVGGFQSL